MLILVILGLLGFIAIVALAVDLGMLYVSRNESQNVADGAALAAAGVLIQLPGNEAAARAEAKKYAAKNYVRGEPVALLDEDIEIFLDDEKVRVWVRNCETDCGDADLTPRGNPIGTFFARVFGKDAVDVVTMAAAEAFPAGGAECLLPIVLPDLWAENEGVECPGGSDGGDCLNTYDDPESESSGPNPDDVYVPYCDNESCSITNSDATGWHPDSAGKQFVLKAANGGGDINSSWYYPWVPVGEEGELEDPGGAAYRERFWECMDGTFAYGDQIATEPGAMVGPTNQGVDSLIATDPTLEWNESLDCPWRPEDPESGCVTSSPRIRAAPMFDPTGAPQEGRQYFTLTNFGSLFIEDRQGGDVMARFMGFAGVAAPDLGDDSETPIKFVRLVE